MGEFAKNVQITVIVKHIWQNWKRTRIFIFKKNSGAKHVLIICPESNVLFQTLRDFFRLNVICETSRICRDHALDVLLIRSCISFLKSHKIWFSRVIVWTNAETHFSFLVLHFSFAKGNGQKHKTYNYLTCYNKMTFQRCNAPFQTWGMKSFLASAVVHLHGFLWCVLWRWLFMVLLLVDWVLWNNKSSPFQPSVSHPWTRKGVTLQKVKEIATLQDFRLSLQDFRLSLQDFRLSAKTWKKEHKNVIRGKSQQLHFKWRKMNVV